MQKSAKPFVLVEWDDPNSSSVEVITEENLSDFHKPALMETGGWLLRDDNSGISLACERYFEQGKPRYRGHTFIGRALVRNVVVGVFRKPRVFKQTEHAAKVNKDEHEA